MDITDGKMYFRRELSFGKTMDYATSGQLQDVEVEDIAGMLSVAEWDISAGRARRGAHGFVLASGVGTVRIDGAGTTIEAPCVIWLPSGVIALVRLEAGSRGVMFTV